MCMISPPHLQLTILYLQLYIHYEPIKIDGIGTIILVRRKRICTHDAPGYLHREKDITQTSLSAGTGFFFKFLMIAEKINLVRGSGSSVCLCDTELGL